MTVAQAADPFAHPVTDPQLLRSTLARPAARLARARTLRGEFHQSRQLREVPKPLIATGEFLFARDLGVYWHTRRPFDSVVVLNDDGMTQIDEGAEALRIPAREQPAVRLIGNLFTALFTLDLARLGHDFALHSVTEGSGDAARWTLGLVPRASGLAGVIRRVTVTGSADVEKVELEDAHGERTVIELGAIEYSPAAPPADVLALLAPKRP
jgi:outer membrane lipoprotein-sorting protein